MTNCPIKEKLELKYLDKNKLYDTDAKFETYAYVYEEYDKDNDDNMKSDRFFMTNSIHSKIDDFYIKKLKRVSKEDYKTYINKFLMNDRRPCKDFVFSIDYNSLGNSCY